MDRNFFKKATWLSLFILGFCSLVRLEKNHASEEIESLIISASRLDTPSDEVASSFTVISRSEIEQKQKNHVSELLRDVPGLSVMNSGGPGKTTSVFIRGAHPDHTLVLMDGIEMNDPMHPSRGFDFGSLSPQDIEQIEIIRGSQSVLYGSNAIGGVIQFFTKKGLGTPHIKIGTEYGSYNSYRLQGSFEGGSPFYNYFLGIGHYETEGFPAADRNLGNNVNTGQKLTSITGNFETKLYSKTQIQALTRISLSRFGLAASGGPPGYDSFGNRTGDDPTLIGANQALTAKLQLRNHTYDRWEPQLALFFSSDRKSVDHTPNPVNPTESHSLFESQKLRGLFQNNYFLSDQDTVIVGFESALENGNSILISNFDSTDTGLKDKSNILSSIFLENQWSSELFFMSSGIRYDHYSRGGGRGTYRIAPGYRVSKTQTLLKGSLGTGFKAPSLYQRFSNYGNSDLQAELSTSYDLGVEQELKTLYLRFGVTYFHIFFNQLIDYDFTSRHYINTGTATSEGIELSAQTSLLQKMKLNFVYSYLSTQDGSTHLPLLRRPLHQISFETQYDFSSQAQVSLTGRYVGQRDDLDAVSFQRLKMPGFAVFSLNSYYQISPKFRVFAKIENLLDRQYEEINGYGTAGRSFFIGFNQEL